MEDIVEFIIVAILGIAALIFIGFVLKLLCSQGLGILVGLGAIYAAVYFRAIKIKKRKNK